MRAPFSEMLPTRRGVSILTRGVAAIAASRLTMAAGWAGALAAGGAGGEPAGGGWRRGRAGLRGGTAGRGARACRLRRLGQFGLGLALRALLFHLRHVVE